VVTACSVAGLMTVYSGMACVPGGEPAGRPRFGWVRSGLSYMRSKPRCSSQSVTAASKAASSTRA